jgi:hypothetical protein
VEAQRWAGHPFAYHTVGSAMAVRRNAYLSQGGMNTRQAGEDFYFLQKFIETGRLQELNSTTVYPAVRESLRVPFGTGKAMHQIMSEKKEWKTNSMETWKLIRPLFQQIPELYMFSRTAVEDHSYETLGKLMHLDDRLLRWLEENDFLAECRSIANHTASAETFQKRFFRYFNAFRMIRYAHDMRELYFEDVGVGEAVREMMRTWGKWE